MEAQSELMLEMFLKSLSVRNLHRAILGLALRLTGSRIYWRSAGAGWLVYSNSSNSSVVNFACFNI